MRTVAVLFAREDSIYKSIDGCDVWDQKRDALKWNARSPIVAHPPCGLWGRLAHMSKAPAAERKLALWAVCQVRINGGVLEHPATSKLWPEAALPEPGEYDGWGGFTIALPQAWFGHKAEKATRFYIVGTTPSNLPEVPLKLGESSHVVDTAKSIGKGDPRWRPCITKPEREHTPPDLARWLVAIARLCNP